MRHFRLLLSLISLFVMGLVSVGGYLTRDTWMPYLGLSKPQEDEEHGAMAPPAEPKMLKLSEQARANLQLTSQPLKPGQYWRKLQVPGIVVDRPGRSDRGVTSPAVAVVAKVHAFPGDTVKPGDRLFTLKLVSEYLHNAQSELFKATSDAQLAQQEKDRLLPLVRAGGVPESKIIELESQLKRINASRQSYRQDLLARGLSPTQVDAVAEGKFVNEIEIVAPEPASEDGQLVPSGNGKSASSNGSNFSYEVEALKVDLGRQVQAGEILCILANHQSLYIEGHGFKQEANLLEQAAQNDWPLEVEFAEDDPERWPPVTQSFRIRHLANTVDPDSRTFSFFVPLANQARSYQKDGKTFLVWRFRPGQRVRLLVPVEKFDEVLVLPAAALAREGPETFVFLQDGDLFERVPVKVLHEDRLNVVLPKDSFPLERYVAQGSGASLNRVLKAQNSSGSGLPPGAHFHADGSLHIPGK